MTNINTTAFTISNCIVVIHQTIEKVRKCVASHQINNVINIWNRPFINRIYNLPFNLLVPIFCKGKTGQSKLWKESYNLLGLQRKSPNLELSSKSTMLRITSIKLYYNSIISSIDIIISNNNPVLFDNINLLNLPHLANSLKLLAPPKNLLPFLDLLSENLE